MTAAKSPRMNANNVIIAGSLAPSVAASGAGPALLGELHDQDAVLGGQSDQHDHADLRIEIKRQDRDREERSDHADGDRQQDRRGIVQLS